jgi:hypothetical protein
VSYKTENIGLMSPFSLVEEVLIASLGHALKFVAFDAS